MGQVYEADDPELSRRVALKILPVAADRAVVSDELLRAEAQRLASLSHPNVISVFDAGTHQGRVFIAMELVRGATLREFIAKQQRRGAGGQAAICRVFADAARGLLAAHEAGIVHRDFKPDNVMVTQSGRVLVMDFGLALVAGQGGGGSYAHAGTPAYMAPEQIVGGSVGPYSDQFSFCVALYEALYAVRPFDADTPQERLERIRSGQTHVGEREARVPKRVRQALRIGLSVRPRDRFDGLGPLIDLLQPPPPWGRYLALASVLTVLGGGVGWVLGSDTASVCSQPQRHVEGLWSPAKSEGLARRLPRVRDAVQLQRRIDSQISAGLSEWTRAFEGACTQAAEDDIDGALARDPRVSCLLGQLPAMQSKLEVLDRWEQPRLSAVLDVVEGLNRPSECGGRRRLDPWLDAPERLSGFIREARRSLANAHAMRVTGQFESGLVEARAVLERARGAGYGPVLATALYESATLQSKLGDYVGALELLAEAFPLAYKHDLHALVADVSIAQCVILGSYLGDVSRGATHAQMAMAAIEKIGPDPDRLSQVLVSTAQMQRHEGKLDDARATMERAIALRTENGGRRSRPVAYALDNLGSLLVEQGDVRGAYDSLSEAHAIFTEVYGPEHPALIGVLISRGHAQLALGRTREARADFEDAEALARDALSPVHPSVYRARAGLGRVLVEQGRPHEGEDLLAQAEAQLASTLGSEHRETRQVQGWIADLASSPPEKSPFEERKSASEGNHEIGAQ